MKDKSISKQNWTIILICFFVYALSYVGKLGYNANTEVIGKEFGVSHTQVSIVTTLFFISYGVGQIVNGLFVKRYNVKVVIPTALIVSAVLNLLAGVVTNFGVIKFLWLINGFSLSVLWPSLTRVIAENVLPEYKPKAVLVMGTTVASGTLLTYLLSGWYVRLGNFRYIFFTAFAVIVVVAVAFVLVYCSFCKSKAVAQPNEQNGQATQQSAQPTQSATKQANGTASKQLLPMLVVLAIFAVVTNLVYHGMQTWFPCILVENYGVESSISIFLTMLLPIGAIFGTAVAVFVQKRISNYVVLCTVFFGTIAVLMIVNYFVSLPIVLFVVLFAIVCCLGSGLNNIITSMMPIYLGGKLNTGMVAGVLNGFCYVGSALSSYVLASIADKYGWDMSFVVLIFSVLTVVALGVVFTLVTNKKQKN